MFKSWCATQKFNNATNLSHVLMDGGVLSVPFDKLNAFYEKYIEAVNQGEKLFVVEQKSKTYNFFVDLDYKGDESLTIEEIKDICKVICDKVKRHGGKECLISVAPPKKSGTK
jgi:divalent metal cation (Fe/Co/Zn/Cd) transporter